jgi:hypothetical protein
MLYNVRVGSKWLFDDYVETTAERWYDVSEFSRSHIWTMYGR